MSFRRSGVRDFARAFPPFLVIHVMNFSTSGCLFFLGLMAPETIGASVTPCQIYACKPTCKHIMSCHSRLLASTVMSVGHHLVGVAEKKLRRGGAVIIPRDFECWYCRNNRHERCALRETCACRICYPRESACTRCQGVCSWACFSKPRDPHAQFQEGTVANQTLDRFLAS